MTERITVVEQQKIVYEGIFSVSELYNMISDFFEKKNYDKRELRNAENVTTSGKYIEILIEPYKTISDYIKRVIRVKIIGENIVDVVVEKHGKKLKMNKGKVMLVLDAFIDTDFEGRWQSKPIWTFFKTIMDRYLFKPYTESYSAGVKADYELLQKNIKSFLNLYQY